MKAAKIIIIDPQNDFTNVDGAYAKRHGLAQITKAKAQINRLLALCGKDTMIVLRSDYRENQFGEGLKMCLPGTFGNQIDQDLSLDHTYTFLTKSEHSGFTTEEFKSYLAATGTTTLFLCGFLAEYCVRQTAMDALQHGYQVHLIADCIGTGDDVQERKEIMLNELEAMGAKTIDSITRFSRSYKVS